MSEEAKSADDCSCRIGVKHEEFLVVDLAKDPWANRDLNNQHWRPIIAVRQRSLRNATPVRPLSLKQLRTIQQHGNRTVVNEAHLHVGLKFTAFDVNALPFCNCHKLFVELVRLFRASGFNEAGASALTAVSVERELADDE